MQLTLIRACLPCLVLHALLLPPLGSACSPEALRQYQEASESRNYAELASQGLGLQQSAMQSPSMALHCARAMAPIGHAQATQPSLGLAFELYRIAREKVAEIAVDQEHERACAYAELAVLHNEMGHYRELLSMHTLHFAQLEAALTAQPDCFARYASEVILALLVDERVAEATSLAVQVYSDLRTSDSARASISIALGSGYLEKSQRDLALGAFAEALKRAPHEPLSAVAEYWLALKSYALGSEGQYRSLLQSIRAKIEGRNERWAIDLKQKLAGLGLPPADTAFPKSESRSALERVQRDFTLSTQEK